jgi:hypothetical protein
MFMAPGPYVRQQTDHACAPSLTSWSRLNADSRAVTQILGNATIVFERHHFLLATDSCWEAIGWKIDASFRELNNRIHPKSHIGKLRGLLPEKYSPLRANGDGLQSVYLAEVGRPFAAAPA